MVNNNAQLTRVVFNERPSLIYCCDVTIFVGEVNLAHRAGTIAGDEDGCGVMFALCPILQCEATVIRKVRVTANKIRKGAGTRGAESLWVNGERRLKLWTVTAFTVGHSITLALATLDVGLPQYEVPLALLSFNIGIELGQLLFMAVLYPIMPGTRKLAQNWPTWYRQVPIYGIGMLGFFWFAERTTNKARHLA